MVLVLKNTKPAFRDWYQQNKQQLSEKRKSRYAEDADYRQRVKEASKRNRESGPLPTPVGHLFFSQAADRLDITVARLREWRSKDYFPEPLQQNGRLWFSENQIGLLKELQQFFVLHGKRTWRTYKKQLLRELVEHIHASWFG
jgi:hypothetical protein